MSTEGKKRLKMVLNIEKLTVTAVENFGTPEVKEHEFSLTLGQDSEGFKKLALYGFCSYLQNVVAPMKDSSIEEKIKAMREGAESINTGKKKERKNAKGSKEPSLSLSSIVDSLKIMVAGMKVKDAIATLTVMGNSDERLKTLLMPMIEELSSKKREK